MAKKYSKDVAIYYDGYDIGTAMTSMQLSIAVDALDPTSLGDSAERVLAAIRKDALEVSGLFDDDSMALDAAAALIGSSTGIFSVSFGTAAGAISYVGTAFFKQFKPAAKIGDLVKLEGAFKPMQLLQRGKLLYGKGAVGSGTTDSLDNGGSSASGTVYIHVFNSPNQTEDIQFEDSPDNSTWAVRKIFNNPPSHTSTSYAETGSVIQRYTRLNMPSGGLTLAAILFRD